MRDSGTFPRCSFCIIERQWTVGNHGCNWGHLATGDQWRELPNTSHPTTTCRHSAWLCSPPRRNLVSGHRCRFHGTSCDRHPALPTPTAFHWRWGDPAGWLSAKTCVYAGFLQHSSSAWCLFYRQLSMCDSDVIQWVCIFRVMWMLNLAFTSLC